MTRKTLPEDATLAHQAAHAFHNVAIRELQGRSDERPTDSTVADIVGESRQNYSDALRIGRCSLNRVAKWLLAWNSNPERHRIHLTTDGEEVTVFGDSDTISVTISSADGAKKPSSFQAYFEGMPVADYRYAWWALIDGMAFWSQVPWTFPAQTEFKRRSSLPDSNKDACNVPEYFFFYEPHELEGRDESACEGEFAVRLIQVHEGLLLLLDLDGSRKPSWMLLNPAKKIGEFRSRREGKVPWVLVEDRTAFNLQEG